MDQEELKRKLMGLWEKTTHNSKEYLATLFDYYFDENLVEYKEIEGKIVSAIFGIPYSFGFGKNRLNGLYLISLSSEEGFRKKGVLAELLNNFNHKVKEDYDFTFLVPHTELLADYFGSQNYLSSFFILEERFTPLHNFRNDYILSLTDSDERIKKLKLELLNEINVVMNDDSSEFTNEQVIQFIKNIEKKGSSSVNITHTERDIEYLLNPDCIRHLNSFIAYDADGKITGVAFTEKEDIKRIKVVAAYVSDSCSYYALLDFIKRMFGDFSLSIITSDPKFQILSIIQQTYASSNPNGGDLDNTFSTVEIPFNINKLLHPLGMVRLLRFDNLMHFIAENRSDVDFRLFIRDYNRSDNTEDESADENQEITIYNVKNGVCKIEKSTFPIKDKTILSLSSKEVSELLLRKNDSSNLIMEAFGIPRLNLQIRLLPY